MKNTNAYYVSRYLRIMKHVICNLLYIALSLGNASAQKTDSLCYRIIDSKSLKEITLDELCIKLADAQVIFFGEEHQDSVAHAFESKLLEQLHQTYGQVSLSMEMLQSDVQLVLDEYLSGYIPEKNFAQDAKLWNNYADYRPLIEFAKDKNIPVLAANAPSRYSNRVTKLGLEALDSMSSAAMQLIAPLPIDTLTGRYYEKFVEAMGGNHITGMHFFQSQNLWDATMAYRINAFNIIHPKNKILHINGRFHSDEKLGTVAQLDRYNSNLTVSVISFSSQNDKNLKDEELRNLADFVVIRNH